MAMSFDDKYSSCVCLFKKIDKPDYAMSKINLYADFVELSVVFSKGDGISYGDILDTLFGEPDDKNKSEDNDKNEAFIGRIISIILERRDVYGDEYPFEYGDDRVLALKSDLSLPQRLYLFLLISSSLNVFEPFKSEITKDFETISYEALKSLIPNAIVRQFGKNTVYRGYARDKIRSLANDIGIPVKDSSLNCIDPRNVQERGLDIVLWLPFEDKCQNRIVFFCQCACGKNFEEKQHDLRRFQNYFVFCKTFPQKTLFIPYSLYNPNDRTFYHQDLIEDGYLIFERLRIINLAKKNNNIFASLNSAGLIDKCIYEYGSN